MEKSDSMETYQIKHLMKIHGFQMQVVIISGNKITFVGSTSDAISKNDESQIIDLAGAVVVPGLVDSHTHVFCGRGNRKS